MSIKIVFNDVDECLSKKLPSDGVSFSQQHLKDITKFSNLVNQYNQTEFILCSGRTFHQLEEIINKIGKLKWVIHENGSIIRNLISGEEINLASSHPAKKYLSPLKNYAEKFADKRRIPEKENMLTIDVGADGESNPSYFQSFLRTLPLDLIRHSLNVGISFGWDPTAINVTLSISKYNGIEKLLSVISKKNKSSIKDLANQSLYIGDSTSDIEGMRACMFAATPSNGDENNIKVQKFISEFYSGKNRGYISSLSYGKGNRDCIKYFLGR